MSLSFKSARDGRASIEVTGLALRFYRGVIDLSGFGRETLIWPRWIFIRLLGLIFILAFAGWCLDGAALISPRGIQPAAETLRLVAAHYEAPWRYLLFPTALWFGASLAFVKVLAWTGLAASIALTLNLWPRLSLTLCWLLYLSLIVPAFFFTNRIQDSLLAETAMLAIPFAPAGLRPGLGRASPPHPLAVLFLRYLVFRLLFAAGFSKLTVPGSLWLKLEYMNTMHEKTAFPGYLGYLDQQLPRAWHAFETAYAPVAELGCAILILFGRGPKIAGALLFFVLQLMIALTGNFGWLNLMALSFIVLLFDDALLGRPGAQMSANSEKRATLALWTPLWAANAGCGTFLFALLVFGGPQALQFSRLGGMIHDFPARLGSLYAPFSDFFPNHFAVEIAGTDDDGKTWKPYEYKYAVLDERRMSPMCAPYLPLFDFAVDQWGEVSIRHPFWANTGRRLLEGEKLVSALFRTDPFAEKPPQAIRIRRYDMTFTDWSEYKDSGRFWNRKLLDETTVGPR